MSCSCEIKYMAGKTIVTYLYNSSGNLIPSHVHLEDRMVCNSCGYYFTTKETVVDYFVATQLPEAMKIMDANKKKKNDWEQAEIDWEGGVEEF